jgi:hypothetical protein
MAIFDPNFKHARANPATTQTNTNLIAAKADAFVGVAHIYLSSDTEMTITLLNSETHSVVHRQYIGARGGESTPLTIRSIYGEGIDYSTSTNGNVFIDLEYAYSK